MTDALHQFEGMWARPRPLVWSEKDENDLVAQTIIGKFQIRSVIIPDQRGFQHQVWVCTLEEQAFSILISDEQSAKSVAAISQIIHQDTPVVLDWKKQGNILTSQGKNAQWHILPSDSLIKGWQVLRNEEPALIALSSIEQAKEASAQYMAWIWMQMTQPAGNS